MTSYQQKPFRSILVGAVISMAAVTGAHADGKAFQMASLAPASPTTVFSVALSEVLKKEHGYRFQISNGTAATRQAVEAANRRLDLYVTAVSINYYMKNGLRMYKKMKSAPDLFKNLRGIINYPLGAYHPVVWADSGIKTLRDIKGKKVFTGPPSGAARPTCEQIIEGVSGYKPGADFTRVNLDWSSAQQAFRDRQIDVYFVPVSIPSPQLEELSALGKIRILTIDDESAKNETLKKATSIPGRKFALVPPGTYANLVNTKPARVVESTVGLGTNKWMSDEDAYKIAKGIFEHKADLVASGQWIASVTPKTALADMNMPLHRGAARYFREIGVAIPPAAAPVD